MRQWEEMDAYFEDIIDRETARAVETRGEEEWVKGDDMPVAQGEYLIKGYGMVGGVRKDFLVANEPYFTVEDYFYDRGDRWTPPCEEFNVVGHWDIEPLKNMGYKDVHVEGWMQLPDDWDGTQEVA